MNQPFSLVDFLEYCLFSILLIPSFIFCIPFTFAGFKVLFPFNFLEMDT